MIGVLVGDEDSVETIRLDAQGGEAPESLFATETGVHEEAGTLGLEQSGIARTARRENGDPETDSRPREPHEAKAAPEDDGKAIWQSQSKLRKNKCTKDEAARTLASNAESRAAKLEGEVSRSESEAVQVADDGGGDAAGLEQFLRKLEDFVAGDSFHLRDPIFRRDIAAVVDVLARQ